MVRKRDELADPTSYLNRARDDEWIFPVLGRDLAFAATARKWIDERLRLGLNQPGDAQLVEMEQAIVAVMAQQGATL